jgi:hypothetical protein
MVIHEFLPIYRGRLSAKIGTGGECMNTLDYRNFLTRSENVFETYSREPDGTLLSFLLVCVPLITIIIILTSNISYFDNDDK